jgi:NAD(P)-dependent dehydrogenase (short-subunit alcohol dehydrogenase family)
VTLDGKVAVVTGAAWGIGRAIAARLAGDGASVVLAARGLPARRHAWNRARARADAAGGGGAILNVSSIAAFGPLPHSFVEYAVAKAALVRLTECLAPLAEDGIRVTCLAPGWTATEFIRERLEAMSPEERAEARDGLAGRRRPGCASPKRSRERPSSS